MPNSLIYFYTPAIQILEASYITGSDSCSVEFRIEFQIVHGICNHGGYNKSYYIIPF